MTPTPPPRDDAAYDRHFEPASLWGLLRRGHPYDFRETYGITRDLYGYDAHYVNLGLWDAPAVEPGRALALFVADRLDLRGGDEIVEVGAGLGQAAVDLTTLRGVGRVVGLNPNTRQVAFARDLAASAGVADRIHHVEADATRWLRDATAASCDGVLAIECVGHLPEPEAFLRDVRLTLRPGRRLSFCGSMTRGDLSAAERLWVRASFGFVPAPEATWRRRLSDAGFVDVDVVDLTARVLVPLTDRLRDDPLTPVPRSSRFLVRRLIDATARAAREGRVAYLAIRATAPGGPP